MRRQRCRRTAQADREVGMAAVQQNGEALRYASAALQADRSVVMAAVQQNGNALQYASAALQADRIVVMAAAKTSSEALMHSAAELKDDRDFVLAVVQRDGRALAHAPARLKEDKDVVLAAVAQRGYAIQYAAPSLQEDRLVVLVAAARGVGRHILWSFRDDPVDCRLRCLDTAPCYRRMIETPLSCRALPHALLRLKLYAYLQYVPKMLDEDITVELLPSLGHDELKDLGMATIGARLGFIAAAKPSDRDTVDLTADEDEVGPGNNGGGGGAAASRGGGAAGGGESQGGGGGSRGLKRMLTH